MPQTNLLRAITYRLTTTPVHQLPHVVYYLAQSLHECSDSFSAANEDQPNETATLVQKLRVKISALLQDREQDARFCAVILIKAVIEVGGFDGLRKSEPWARLLLNNLRKREPPSIHRLTIIVLTRIFSLTLDHPALLREITAPLLPSFIPSVLNLLQPSVTTDGDTPVTILSPLLLPGLLSWNTLLPVSPATFRPFLARIGAICTHLIGEGSTSCKLTSISCKILARLPLCAGKNAVEAEWSKLCHRAVNSINIIANKLLAGVSEDWELTHPDLRSVRTGNAEQDGLSDGLVFTELLKWRNLHQATRNIEALIDLLSRVLQQPIQQSCPVPVSLILDLSSRLVFATPAMQSEKHGTKAPATGEIGRERSDELFTCLPSFCKAILHLESKMVEIFADAVLPVWLNIWDQAVHVFSRNSDNPEVKSAIYQLLVKLLPVAGPSIRKAEIKSAAVVISNCCEDALRQTTWEDEKAEWTSRAHETNTTKSTRNYHSLQPPSALTQQSHDLLLELLTHVPGKQIPHALRTEIDRTLIVAGRPQSLLASTLNPSQRDSIGASTPSLLPFLLQVECEQLSSGALLRPRVAAVQGVPHNKEELDEDERNADYTPYVADLDQPRSLSPPTVYDNSQLASLSNVGAMSGFVPEETQLQISADQEVAEGAWGDRKRSHEAISANNSTPSVLETADEYDRTGGSDPKRQLLEDIRLKKESQDSELVSKSSFLTSGVSLHTTPTGEKLSPSETTTSNPPPKGPNSLEAHPQRWSLYPTTFENEDSGSESDMPEINIEPDTEDEDDEAEEGAEEVEA